MHFAFYNSPIGTLQIQANENAVTQLFFTANAVSSGVDSREDLPPILRQCCEELELYFTAKLSKFTVPIELQGTDFQKDVLALVQQIPLGTTASYLQIAQRLNNPKSVRAVGRANALNPILLLIPCHRVVATNRALVGYAGALWRKKWLLQHEINQLCVPKNMLF